MRYIAVICLVLVYLMAPYGMAHPTIFLHLNDTFFTYRDSPSGTMLSTLKSSVQTDDLQVNRYEKLHLKDKLTEASLDPDSSIASGGSLAIGDCGPLLDIQAAPGPVTQISSFEELDPRLIRYAFDRVYICGEQGLAESNLIFVAKDLYFMNLDLHIECKGKHSLAFDSDRFHLLGTNQFQVHTPSKQKQISRMGCHTFLEAESLDDENGILKFEFTATNRPSSP